MRKASSTTYNCLRDKAPSLFRKPFIASLWRYSEFLRVLGHSEEALGACRKAVNWCRVLCEETPLEFARYLATSLLNLASYLHSMDKAGEAVVLLEERVTIYRRMCQDPQYSRSEYPELLGEALDAAQRTLDAASSGTVPRLQIILSEDALR